MVGGSRCAVVVGLGSVERGTDVVEGRRRGTEGEGEATIGWVGSGEWVTNPRFWLYMNPV